MSDKIEFDEEKTWLSYVGQKWVAGTLETVKIDLWDCASIDMDSPVEILKFFQHSRHPYPSRTNLDMPSMLPNPCAMLVREVSIRVSRPKVLKNSYFYLMVGNKMKAEVPLSSFVFVDGEFKSDRLLVMLPPLLMFGGFIRWDVASRMTAEFQMTFSGLFVRAIS